MHDHLLHFLSNLMWISRHHINLVENRHNGQILVKRKKEVCDSLGLQQRRCLFRRWLGSLIKSCVRDRYITGESV